MEYSVKLCRDSLQSAWGFRLQGGADLKSALTIQRVFSGSPAEGELQRGDIILTIDNRDTSNLTHQSAEQIIKSAGGQLHLRIKRTGPNQSLPHTDFTSNQNSAAKNMWGQQAGGPAAYGQPRYSAENYYNASPSSGSKHQLSSQDQAMLNLVNHSLGSKLRPAVSKSASSSSSLRNPAAASGYYNEEPNNQRHYGWVPVHGPTSPYGSLPANKSYQPQNFNKPAAGPLAYKPAKNPYSSTAQAAHLQYNSPLSLYSAKNAQNVLSASVPGDSAAGQTIKLSAYHGGETKGDVVDSPTLRYVLREDQIKAKTGHKPDVKFYREVKEYGPGKVPLKAYKEEVDDVMPTSDF